jgi:hypothetical protein
MGVSVRVSGGTYLCFYRGSINSRSAAAPASSTHATALEASGTLKASVTLKATLTLLKLRETTLARRIVTIQTGHIPGAGAESATLLALSAEIASLSPLRTETASPFPLTGKITRLCPLACRLAALTFILRQAD